MECEVCGREAEKLVKVEMERSEFLVCENCAKYGRKLEQEYEKEQKVKVIMTRSKISEPKSEKLEKSGELVLVKDFGQRIRKAREKRKLTIKEVAEKLFEKESYLHRIESQAIQPSDALIEKLEKFFGLSLREKLEGE